MAFAEVRIEKTGKHGKQFQLLSTLLHAHVRSVLLKSNQIPSVLSARTLSGECTWNPAQTCHSEEASPIPQQSFAFHFFFASTREAESYRGPCLSGHLFSSDAGPSRKTVWYGADAWLISLASRTSLRRVQGGVAFRGDKPGWRLGEMEWVAPRVSVTTALVICCTVSRWSEEVAGCDWAVSAWQADSYDQQYASHSSNNSKIILHRPWLILVEKTYLSTNTCSSFVNHAPEDWLIRIGIYSLSRSNAQQWHVFLLWHICHMRNIFSSDITDITECEDWVG